MSRRYLITGGCGFIGSRLCSDLIARGDEVSVLDNLTTGSANSLPDGAQLHIGDICDRDAVLSAMRGVDAVFHLAAISSVEICVENWALATRVNLSGSVNVVDAAGDIPVVFASSAAVYGNQESLPIPETAPTAPMSPYAVDKLAAEGHLQAAAELRGGRATILRPFNVFGPGQNADSPYSGVMTLFASQAIAGRSLTVKGDGLQTRDFVHVSDVSRAMCAAMDKTFCTDAGAFLRINVCTGQAISIMDLAHKIRHISGSTAPVIHTDARLGDIRHSVGDPSQAERHLGWTAQAGLDEGIEELLSSLSPTGNSDTAHSLA